MEFLLSAVLVVIGYIVYVVFDTALNGAISGYVVPYFAWIHPNTFWGGVGFSFIILLPVYALLTFFLWVYIRRATIEEEEPHFLLLFYFSETRLSRPLWPLFPTGLLGLILVFSLFGVAVKRLAPVHWTLGLIIWVGLVGNYIRVSKPPAKKPAKEKESKEGEESKPPVRITAEELIKKLRKSPAYRGQIVRDTGNIEPVKSTPSRTDIGSLFTTPSLKQVLSKAGIKSLYLHQERFLNILRAGEDAAFAMPFRSGKSTACDLFALQVTLGATQNVLYITLNEERGEACYRRFTNMLKEGNAQWAVKVSAFLDRKKTFEFESDIPEILFVTPETLHHSMLPGHRKWQFFLSALGLVIFEDIEDYKGVYGANCAFVFRRLLRLCSHYRTNPQVACTSIYITNIGTFLNELTGRIFEEENIVTSDSRGSCRKDLIFWSPPLEKKERLLVSESTSPLLKRNNYYEEAKRVLIEAFLEGFDTLLLPKQMLITERDTRSAEEEIKKRLEETAKSRYRAGLGTIIGMAEESIESLESKKKECESHLEKLEEERLEAKVKASASDETSNTDDKGATDKPLEHARECLYAIETEIVPLPSTMGQIVESGKPIEDLFRLLNEIEQKVRLHIVFAKKKLAGTLRGSEYLKIMETFEERVGQLVSEIREQLKKNEKDYQIIMERLNRTKRWVIPSINALETTIGISAEDVDAAIVLGCPGALQAVMQDVKYIGGGLTEEQEDLLVCVVLPSVPLSQVYKNHWGDRFWKPSQVYHKLGIANEMIALKHIECALHELPMTVPELQEVFSEVSQTLVDQIPSIKKEAKVMVYSKGDAVEEVEVEYLRHVGEGSPHLTTILTATGKDYHRIIYAPLGEAEKREIGLQDSQRRYEEAYPGAILRVGNQRYRVNYLDDLTSTVRVEELDSDQATWTTERTNEIAFRWTGYLVREKNTGKSFGRLSSGIAKGAFDRDSSLLEIGDTKFEICEVDHGKRVVTVQRSEQPGEPIRVGLFRRFSFRKGEGQAFTVEGGEIQVRETISGYIAYNALDIEDKVAGIHQTFEQEPYFREFLTQGIVISFAGEEIAESILHSVAHLLRAALPDFLAFYPGDLEISYFRSHPEVGCSGILIYDSCPNGLGLSEFLLHHCEELLISLVLETSYQILVDCPCREGCPSCLHVFDCRNDEPNVLLDKRGVTEFLGSLLDKEDYIKVIQYRYDKIDKDEVGVQIRNKVFDQLGHNLGLVWKKPVALVVSTELEERLEKEQGLTPRAGVWTDDTLVVREFPEDEMVHILANEYTHDWEDREGNMNQRLRDPVYIRADILKNFDRSEDMFAEGFCEWVSYRALDFYGLKYRMETYGKYTPSPLVYRAGFEVLKYLEDQFGAAAVIDFIRSGEGYDFEELYQESGVKDYVLASLLRGKK